LPGVHAAASPSSAPRVGIGVSRERFEQVQQNLKQANHAFTGPVEHSQDTPLDLSIYFDDPDGNHLEFCVRRKDPLDECVSHTVFETSELRKAITFYRSSRYGACRLIVATKS